MKKIVITLLAILLAIPSFSQGKYGKDSAECVKYLSYYAEFVKQKNYKEAAPFWRKAISICPPTASQNLFINGQTILRREISGIRNDAVRKQEILDSLIMLHDIRAQYYPKYRVTSLDNKARDIINFNCYGDNPKKQYEALSEIIGTISSNCSPIVYVKQMQLAVELYKQSLLTAEDVMNNYTNTIGYIDCIIDVNSNPDYVSAKHDVESLLMESGVASCDNLVALYTPRYNATPEDKDIVSSMVKMLSSSDCLETELFLKAVESLHKIDPSASSAYYLYRLYASREMNDLAATSLEDAIKMSEGTDVSQAADYYFELATFYFKKLNKSASAVNTAKKVVDLKPELAGKAYLLIGTIWGSQKCSGNEVEARAPFWVAVDYMTKARNADESLAEEANKLAAQYRNYFPMQADAFMYDVIDGSSYTVSCAGMRESTIVRTQK